MHHRHVPIYGINITILNQCITDMCPYIWYQHHPSKSMHHRHVPIYGINITILKSMHHRHVPIYGINITILNQCITDMCPYMVSTSPFLNQCITDMCPYMVSTSPFLTHSLCMMPWGIPRHNPHDALSHSPGFSDVMLHGIIFWCLLDSSVMELLHAQHQSVSQTWPVIVAFVAFIVVVDKKTFVYHNKQREFRLRVALSKLVRRHRNCDITMVVAIGVINASQTCTHTWYQHYPS